MTFFLITNKNKLLFVHNKIILRYPTTIKPTAKKSTWFFSWSPLKINCPSHTQKIVLTAYNNKANSKEKKAKKYLFGWYTFFFAYVCYWFVYQCLHPRLFYYKPFQLPLTWFQLFSYLSCFQHSFFWRSVDIVRFNVFI